MTNHTRGTTEIGPTPYRLPDATCLGPVHLQVSDLGRSTAYYEEVLGLGALAQRNDRVVLGSRDEERPLVVLHTRPGVHPATRRRALGLYHFAILLPDRAALGRFLAHLGRLSAYAGLSDHHVSEAIYLTDPDGLGIEVYADRPRAAWRYDENGQLVMATEPLDVDGVLAAGGDRPWTGMPAGTVLGHVHLHVGDLAAAEAFYHRALGFDKTVWNYPGALFLSAGGYHHHLGTNTWVTGAPAPDDSARLLSWDIVVPTRGDADEAASRLERAGHGVTRLEEGWTATDPWGTTLRLVVATPGEPWNPQNSSSKNS